MPHRPHLFPAALASVMQARGVNQAKLHKLTGIAVSRINNYLRGNYRTITLSHIAAIAKRLCETPADKAALMQTYLFDLLPDGCRGLVDIRVPGDTGGVKWKVPSKGLPEEFAGAFQELYVLCASNVKIRRLTAQWAEIMRETKD